MGALHCAVVNATSTACSFSRLYLIRVLRRMRVRGALIRILRRIAVSWSRVKQRTSVSAHGLAARLGCFQLSKPRSPYRTDGEGGESCHVVALLSPLEASFEGAKVVGNLGAVEE